MEYRPVTMVSGNDAPAFVIDRLHSGTEMNSNADFVVSTGDIRGAIDYKTYDPMRPFKRYYHIAKWASTKEIDWRTSNSALQNAYAGSIDSQTLVRMETLNAPDGVYLGRLTVTYFIDFRGRIAAF